MARYLAAIIAIIAFAIALSSVTKPVSEAIGHKITQEADNRAVAATAALERRTDSYRRRADTWDAVLDYAIPAAQNVIWFGQFVVAGAMVCGLAAWAAWVWRYIRRPQTLYPDRVTGAWPVIQAKPGVPMLDINTGRVMLGDKGEADPQAVAAFWYLQTARVLARAAAGYLKRSPAAGFPAPPLVTPFELAQGGQPTQKKGDSAN